MPKLYVKTVLLSIIFATLFLWRIGLLRVDYQVPNKVLDFGLFTVLVMIGINEKLTRGEHWGKLHYVLLIFVDVVFLMLLLASPFS